MNGHPIINALYGLLLLGLAAAIWRTGRPRRPSEAERAAEARARTGLADWDECELLYSLPAYDPAWEAGRERLWDAIRDNQNNTTEGDL